MIESKGDTQIWEQEDVDDPTAPRIEIKTTETTDGYLCKITSSSGIEIKKETWKDNDGNVIEFKAALNDSITAWTKSKFENGNEVEKEFLVKDKISTSTVETYVYNEFDNVKNWTEKVIYKDGTPQFFVKREIKYIDKK